MIEWVEINGRRYHALGGRVSRAVTNPTFNPITPAGALVDYFRGNPDGRPMHELMGKPEPIRPEYRDRDARLATMDAQGLSKVWLFPTLGMLYEEALKHDPGAVVLLFRAFNRWLAEDWGMAYRGPHLRRALHLAGRRRRGRARAGVGARPGRPGRRACGPPPRSPCGGPLLPGRRRASTLLGPGQRVRHHGGGARRRRRAVLQRLRARRLLRLVPGRAVAAEHQDVRHRAGGPRLLGHLCSRRGG